MEAHLELKMIDLFAAIGSLKRATQRPAYKVKLPESPVLLLLQLMTIESEIVLDTDTHNRLELVSRPAAQERNIAKCARRWRQLPFAGE